MPQFKYFLKDNDGSDFHLGLRSFNYCNCCWKHLAFENWFLRFRKLFSSVFNVFIAIFSNFQTWKFIWKTWLKLMLIEHIKYWLSSTAFLFIQTVWSMVLFIFIDHHNSGSVQCSLFRFKNWYFKERSAKTIWIEDSQCWSDKNIKSIDGFKIYSM